MSDWQDISSAPKDGSTFLFCEAGEKMVYVGRYGRPRAGDVVESTCLTYLSYTDTRGKNYFRLGAFIRCGIAATHWQPLPAPPVSK